MAEREECTGIAAQWCPNCGTCNCPEDPRGGRTRDRATCPLHGAESRHAETLCADNCGEVVAEEGTRCDACEVKHLRAEIEAAAAQRERAERACDSIRRSARALAGRDDDALDAVTVDSQRRAMALWGMRFAGVAMYSRLPADPACQRESDLPPRVPVMEAWDLGAPPSVRLWVVDLDTATLRYMKKAWAEEVAVQVKASPVEVLAEALRLALEPEVVPAAGVQWRAGAGRPQPPTDAELAAHHGRWRCVVPGDVQRNCDAMRPVVARMHRETLAACGVRGALWWALDGDDAVCDWPRVDR